MTRLRLALEVGELAAVDAELDRLARLASESRRTYYRWYLLVLQAARAIFAGQLAEGERLSDEAVELNRRHGDDVDQEHTVQLLALAMIRRRPRDVPLAALRDYAARYPALPVWEAMLAQAEFRLRPEGARRSLDACARDGFAALLRTPDWLCGLSLLAEPAAAAGTEEEVARLYEALSAHAARNVVLDDASAAFGPVARSLGLLAGAAGRGAETGRHFGEAVELARRWQARGWELTAIGDWLRAGASGASGAALRDRGIALARDLDVPWVAAELAQMTMP
jgi:hypothetical protein